MFLPSEPLMHRIIFFDDSLGNNLFTVLLQRSVETNACHDDLDDMRHVSPHMADMFDQTTVYTYLLQCIDGVVRPCKQQILAATKDKVQRPPEKNSNQHYPKCNHPFHSWRRLLPFEHCGALNDSLPSCVVLLQSTGTL